MEQLEDGSLDALAEESHRLLARDHLIEYATFVDPNYVIAPHVQLVAKYLEELEADRIQNLMVLIPPRHGKTRLVSQIFPSWWLGRHPRAEIILASNTANLAEDNSRSVRDLVNSDAYPFATRVRSDSSAVDMWRTTDGGVVKAAGLLGAIQGRGIHCGIIDDPIGSAADIQDGTLEKQWQWFSQDIMRRLLPGGKLILSTFRWNSGDLAGRILEDPEIAKNWTVLRLPALAEPNDPLGRAEGEILWPPSITPDGRKVGYSRDFIEQQRVVGARSFAAQYQLDPVPMEGFTFKAEWLRRRYNPLPYLPGIRFKCMVIDCAMKTGVANDYSAICTWATDGKNYYLVDVWQKKVEFPELKRIVQEKYREHSRCAVLCEEAASGFALIQELRHSTNIPIIAISPRGSKATRAEAVTTLFEAGRVLLPVGLPLLEEWIIQHQTFPANCKHDDLVDCTSMALTWLSQRAAEHRPRNRGRWGVAAQLGAR